MWRPASTSPDVGRSCPSATTPSWLRCPWSSRKPGSTAASFARSPCEGCVRRSGDPRAATRPLRRKAASSARRAGTGSEVAPPRVAGDNRCRPTAASPRRREPVERGPMPGLVVHHLDVTDPCFVAPSPELRERLDKEFAKARGRAKGLLTDVRALAPQPRVLGLDDGVIVPPQEFPLGTPTDLIRSAAAERAPLRGAVRVIVVLVDFSDKQMAAAAQHFKDLFFSTGVLPHGSVKEFYKEATNDLVDITGDVVGVYRMPQTLAWYANGNFGINRPPTAGGTTRARNLAHDAAVAADPDVNYQPYDNDGNGYVDAFVVVHAGSGGEETGDSNDIWSHKWTLPSVYSSDATKIFAYLTIPEDAKVGVCAHELGHLLFGFPDLYDVDDSSEGIGNWCLMAGGSWNGGGDIPAHPSAWCKANQGWVSV